MSGEQTANQPEPLTPVGESAAGLHELFLSLMAAGFTERQALIYLAETVAIAGREGTEE